MSWASRVAFATLTAVSLWTVAYYIVQSQWLTTWSRGGATHHPSPRPMWWGRGRPNFVFVLTDDQDLMLGGMKHMNRTNDFFAKHGMTFTNAFTPVPLCCPSRASILTGKYMHNHHVFNNSLSGNCYGQNWRDEQEKQTFAVHLQQANYTTFYAGKYMNQYGIPADKGAKFVPPGWKHWNGLVGNSVYYNYNLSVDGTAEPHLDKPEDYLTDLISSRAINFLRNHNPNSDDAFFMMLSPPSCHAPFTPSEKHRGAFAGSKAPRTPNYNVTAGKKKHWLLRQAPPHLSDELVEQIDINCGNRWATLLSVDDMISDIIQILNDKRILDNTYIIFTSDNGFHLGQFSLPWDKRQMYDFDLRIPMMISGPGVLKRAVKKSLVVTVDLAPTFLDLAGLPVVPSMNGLSLVPLLIPAAGLAQRNSGAGVPWRTRFVVEYYGEGIDGPVKNCPQYGTHAGVSNCFPNCICEDAFNNTYTCVRTLYDNDNFIFCMFDDNESFTEAYNLSTDPYQLENISPYLSSEKRLQLKNTIRTLRV